jgi:hypothetical protein
MDIYSGAAFMRVECEVEVERDAKAMEAAVDAFWERVEAIVDPFDGDFDDVGFTDGPAPFLRSP